MTKTEIKKALALLGDRAERSQTAGVDGGGLCLTVFWDDGGQRLFYSLEEVESWLAEKPKRGRPATDRGAYNPNPARQFGRVAESDWLEIKEACEAAGQSLVEWGLPALLAKAKRENEQR
jgi:hypothetical protein